MQIFYAVVPRDKKNSQRHRNNLFFKIIIPTLMDRLKRGDLVRITQ